LSPTAAFAGLALPVTMDVGRAVATLPFATERFAGFLRAGLKVLSVLRVGIFVTCVGLTFGISRAALRRRLHAAVRCRPASHDPA
jgi:hypothetical protein